MHRAPDRASCNWRPRSCFDMMPSSGIGERLSRLTPQQRRLLELRMSIRRRLDTTRAGLSRTQRRMWFFCQRQQAARVYVCPRLFEIEGRLDIDRLRAAISQMIDRHEALRTV